MEMQKMSFEDFEWDIENSGYDPVLLEKYGKTTENKIFTDEFTHAGKTALSFKNCIFQGKFTFHKYHPTTKTYITNCVFKKGILFWEVRNNPKILFLDCIIEDLFLISDSQIHELTLNNKYCKRLQFDNLSIISIVDIGGMNCNKIDEIHFSVNIIEKRFTIDNVESLNLYISYSTLSKELNIFNSRINSLELENFRNNGFLRFLNCRSMEVNDKPSQFIISRSNLGKAEFYDFDFASFSKINITNSILLENLFIGSKWTRNIVSEDTFEKQISVKDPIDEKRLYADKMREVYKQIKFALSKQGNSVEEQYFHGLEMNAYNRSLSWKSNLWTKSILKLSFYSSNYGQSILRPLLFLLIFGGIFYSLLKFNLGFRFPGVQEISFSNCIITFSDYLWYMNPLHKNEPEFRGVAFIIDIVIRVISSYCIYNIIRASRRFLK